MKTNPLILTKHYEEEYRSEKPEENNIPSPRKTERGRRHIA